MIIGICGFIGAGKDTVADYLVNLHHFRKESFANSLKDAVAQEEELRWKLEAAKLRVEVWKTEEYTKRVEMKL